MIYVQQYATSGVIDSDAIDRALAAVPPTGCKVVLPAGAIDLQRPIVLSGTYCTTLEGECCQHPYYGRAATELRFPPGCAGIVIKGRPTGRAERCRIKGICFTSLGNGTAHGIETQSARTSIVDCGVYGFGGFGCFIHGSTVDGNNANLFEVRGSTFSGNGSHGLMILGNNANAGTIDVSVESNGGYGVCEQGTYGNTYLGGQSSGNKLGAYLVDGPSVCSLLLGFYTEGGQPPAWLSARAMAIGAMQGAGYDLTPKPGKPMGSVIQSATSGLQLPLLQELLLAGITVPTGGTPGAVIPINGKLVWVCGAPNRWSMRVI